MNYLVVLRGSCGSGKSILAKNLAKSGGVICSADAFFMENGKYVFRQENLGKAHGACLRLAADSMETGVNWVIIDNTNTQYKEVENYLALANKFKYKVWVVEAPNNHLPSEELFKRNTHGVPLNTINKMKARYLNNDTLIETARTKYPKLNITGIVSGASY